MCSRDDAPGSPDRVFARWSMARVGDGDGADIPVRVDRETPGVAPAAPPLDDPRHETMLDLMREYALAGARPL